MFHQSNRFAVSVEKQGPRRIAKASFPLRYGKYSEIKTSEYEFVFNLNGEIKFIRGLNTRWPHPAEQLKRTDGNDWVYYTLGDKSSEQGISSWLGEYYLPCLPYISNSIWEVSYLSSPNIMNAFAAWAQLYADLYGAGRDRLHPKVNELVDLVLKNDDRFLFERAQELRAISNGKVSVLPPDSRHVDYEIIPLMIADGCLYQCDFCCIKTSEHFRMHSRENILEQIRRLKIFYGRNLGNYRALFLGNHDALAAGEELIRFAAEESWNAFGFEDPDEDRTLLFLFGSVASLLKSGDKVFDRLDELPFHTYLNIGFESPDAATLKSIGKPVAVSSIKDAFRKMLEVNAAYPHIEITGNFLLGQQLSAEHYSSLAELLGSASPPSPGKGAVYLSPLKDSRKKRELLPKFFELKSKSRLPVYVYLIQRL